MEIIVLASGVLGPRCLLEAFLLAATVMAGHAVTGGAAADLDCPLAAGAGGLPGNGHGCGGDHAGPACHFLCAGVAAVPPGRSEGPGGLFPIVATPAAPVPAGMMGDRASVVFAAPAEIGPFIKNGC